jgi:hypothetical protein
MNVKRIVGIIGLLVALIPTGPQVRGQVVKIQNVDLGIVSPSYYPAGVNNNDWVAGVYTNAAGTTLGFLNPGPGQPSQRIFYPDTNESDHFTRANGINDSGTVVGDFFGSDGVFHGYFYSNGAYSVPWDLQGFNEHRNKFSTSLFGISFGGNLAGAANPHPPVTEGFAVIGGTTYEFTAPNSSFTYAYAVNDAGVAVGEFFDSGNHSHGFMWSQAGGFTQIDYPVSLGGNPLGGTICNGINNSGEIIGTYLDGAGYIHGFTDINGVFTTLDLPAFAVSNSGSYVGTYTAPGGAQRGYEAWPTSIQTPVTVNVTGAQSTSLYGISSSGTMCGKYTDASGVNHGMVLFSPNNIITVDDPNAYGNSTVCEGLSATDTIVNYTDANGHSHADFWEYPTMFIPIIISLATDVSIYGIDDNSAVICGSYTDILGNTYGWTKPSIRSLILNTVTVPGATFTVVSRAVNSQVAAYWGDSAGYVESAVASRGHGWQTQNLPGATNCFVTSIDHEGDLVYLWTDPEGNVHAGYYNNTAGSQAYYLLDYPGGFGTRAYGIQHLEGGRLPGPTVVGRFFATPTSTNFNGFTWDLW